MRSTGLGFAGFDIGGANIKFASLDGQAVEVPFEMWKHPERLGETLREMAMDLSPDTLVGITMTAELADCFSTKQEGVCFVVDEVEKSLSRFSPRFYGTNGEMVNGITAKRDWKLIAAANWHALAWMAFKRTEKSSGFLVDIGSTTTDIIPVSNGLPVDQCQTDLDRLTNGQLLYAGMERTSVCSLLDEIMLDGACVSIARELFATTADAFRWLGEMDCDSDSLNTVDGRSASKNESGSRLARMVCADATELGEGNITAIATQTKEALVGLVKSKFQKVRDQHADLPEFCLVTGAGGWLVSHVMEHTFPEIEIKTYNPDRTKAQCAAAEAVAMKRMESATKECDDQI